ncbi:hypothetical protein KCP71_16775 [Salmonella enterica subsp. enterica]|nr:hypothetical protein KCP71_16775 [Salmonella enterica subsp. enterica]
MPRVFITIAGYLPPHNRVHARNAGSVHASLRRPERLTHASSGLTSRYRP